MLCALHVPVDIPGRVRLTWHPMVCCARALDLCVPLLPHTGCGDTVTQYSPTVVVGGAAMIRCSTTLCSTEAVPRCTTVQRCIMICLRSDSVLSVLGAAIQAGVHAHTVGAHHGALAWQYSFLGAVHAWQYSASGEVQSLASRRGVGWSEQSDMVYPSIARLGKYTKRANQLVQASYMPLSIRASGCGPHARTFLQPCARPCLVTGSNWRARKHPHVCVAKGEEPLGQPDKSEHLVIDALVYAFIETLATQF